MDLTQIVEFLNNEIVGYAIQSVVGFGSGFVGVCALLKRAKKTISDTTTVLGETNTNSSNTNKEVAKTRESVEETKQSVLALKEEVRKEREDLKLQREELMAEFKATMNTVNEFVDSLQPLLNLPQAFAQSVSLNAESVFSSCDDTDIELTEMKEFFNRIIFVSFSFTLFLFSCM